MRIHIIAVGRWKDGPERALFDLYAKRVTWPLAVREIAEKRRLAPARLRRREGELLLAAVPQGALVVALDEQGSALTSRAFAARLSRWRDAGNAALAFLIGGADGLDPAVIQRADLRLSLGPMTWPHLVVRALVAEQLYRAQCILAGHPYHRE